MSTRDQLLSYLKEEKSNWISGEMLSSRLSISRSAIWKHIHVLKEDGYIIESSPKKGYCFMENSEMLLPGEIRENLDTKAFGREEIVYFKETDSTNARARELASKGASEGTIVIAENQTQGRGRKGRSWFSPAEQGIYISLVLRPLIAPNEAPKMTLLTGVAVAETLLSLTDLEINIKWPNDILISGKKVAGILTEISTEMDAIEYVIVGLGLNVNTVSFPDDIKEKATSLFIEAGRHFSRSKLIGNYLKWHEKYYDELKIIGFSPVMKRWKALSNIAGKLVRVEMIDRDITGKVLGIDEDGALIVEDNDGISQRIFAGDVILI
ncbi:biotin--[acetyl-CoA-carboxylase] ligase [Thermodesulfobacteriota bacterium]